MARDNAGEPQGGHGNYLLNVQIALDADNNIDLCLEGTKFSVYGSLALIIALMARELNIEMLEVVNNAFNLFHNLKCNETEQDGWVNDFFRLVQEEAVENGEVEYVDDDIRGLN